MEKIKLAVVIAMYDEEGNVKELTKRLMSSIKVPYEIFYVIDGEDDTINIVKSIPTTKITYSYSRTKRGLANAFLKGYSMVPDEFTHILTMDADLNHMPEQIPDLIKEIGNADIIIGSRYYNNVGMTELPLWKRGVSRLANFVVETALRVPVKDKTSNFRIYRTEFAKDLHNHLQTKGFEFVVEILLVAKKKGLTYKEVPIHMMKRIHGKSKLPLFKTAYNYFWLVLKHLTK